VKRVALIGTGLVGGSVGLALVRAGVEVVGFDRDEARAAAALARGAVTETAAELAMAVVGADLVLVAVPVSTVADVVVAALDAGAALVTDVGSVKAPIVAAITRARPELSTRFVGGHPMAGSEQDGLDGASAELFAGAAWVLTPTEHTDPAAFTAVRLFVVSLGAEAIAVTPEHHDALVAVVSHVPQLAATTLMDVAAGGSEQHATLLRLAAGGFRDMTRIAASHPAIWPDICIANRDAIVHTIDDYVGALGRVRELVAQGNRAGLLEVLERARVARRNLPSGRPTGESLVELRIPVPDRPGVLAEVTTLAGQLGVNIADLEIAHSIEGSAGVIVLVVPDRGLEAFEVALTDHGYHVSRSALA
jgi:prephenate dehydrogenase